MAYIGQRPVIGRYIKLDQISSGFNGSNTGFSMTAGSQAVFPGTARNLLLSLGGVIQEPDTDFTISGSTLTFTTPPVANTTFFGVIYGDMQATGTPSDGTVLPASIASSGNFSFPQVTVTSNLTISSDSPKIFLTDTGDDDDFEIRNDDGTFTIRNSTDGNDIISVASDNATTFTGPITALSTSTFLGAAVFNENGGNVDFRVEGDTDANLLFVDASADKVGIGTSSPTKTLTVQGDILKTRTDSGVGLIYLQNDGSNNGNIVVNQNGGVTRIQLHSDGDSYFNGGDVGIGTTSPDRLLHVRSTGDALFRITSGDGSAAYIELGDASNGDAGKIVYDNGDNLTFTTTNPSDNTTTEKLRIQGNGNVGIGTVSPDSKLKIEDSSNLAIHILKTGSQDTLIKNTGQTEICAATGNSSGQRIAFKIGANTGLLIDIAKFTPDGLCFGSDTAAANALDDYEEGDYLPSFTVQSGSITLDNSHKTLCYTKIGRQVTIIGQLKVASVNSPSGILRASLPINRGDQTEQAERTMGNIMVTNAAVNNANEFTTYPDGGSDHFLEIISISGTSINRNGGNNMQANTYIYVNYTYFSAS